MALLMLAPIFSSIYRMDSDKYELTENLNETEKRESENKDELEDDKKFPILNESELPISFLFNSKFAFQIKGIKDLHSEVITPPPELV